MMRTVTADVANLNVGPTPDAAADAGFGWLSWLVFVCALAVLAGTRWFQPALDRPLNYDEWHTLEYYGWPGLTPAGDMKLIRRAADFEALSRPNMRQLGLGVFRALGVWKEPNNQVPHSLLVNVAAAVQRTPRAVRIPAFIGGLLFSLCVYFLCGPVLKWHWAAPLAGLSAYALPYATEYSQEARGYSLMLALATLLLILGVRLAKRPQGMLLPIVMVIVATASIFNVISLAVDWVLPAYAALAAFPPAVMDGTWKRHLANQWLVIAGLCGVFAMDRLPALALASQKFGETIGTFGEFSGWVGRAGAYLFPGPVWAALGIVGFVGLVAMSGDRQGRFFTALAVSTIVLNGLHFAASHRCPYPRTCGYLLVPVLIGFAFVVEQLVRRMGRTAGLVAWLTLIVGGTASIAVGTARGGASGLTTAASSADNRPERGVYALMQEYDYSAAKFLPEYWETWQDVPAAGDIQFLAVSTTWSGRGVSAIAGNARPAESVGPDPESVVSLFPARGVAFSPETDLPDAKLVVAVWYPDQQRMGMDPAPLTEFIERYSIVSVRRTARLQANYDYYLRPFAYEFLAEGAQARETLRDILKDALRQFGGTAMIIHTQEAGEEP